MSRCVVQKKVAKVRDTPKGFSYRKYKCKFRSKCRSKLSLNKGFWAKWLKMPSWKQCNTFTTLRQHVSIWPCWTEQGKILCHFSNPGKACWNGHSPGGVAQNGQCLNNCKPWHSGPNRSTNLTKSHLDDNSWAHRFYILWLQLQLQQIGLSSG